jgi:hypothetical protein
MQTVGMIDPNISCMVCITSCIVWSTVCIVVLQAAGGLLVAVVVKYADNILKGFAASFAMVITFVISMYFYDFYPNQNFYIGAVRPSFFR